MVNINNNHRGRKARKRWSKQVFVLLAAAFDSKPASYSSSVKNKSCLANRCASEVNGDYVDEQRARLHENRNPEFHCKIGERAETRGCSRRPTANGVAR